MDPSASCIRTAFVLGAGLGTRLRPLTDTWPKPLLNIGGRPLITYAFDHLRDLGVERYVVNTHHAAGRYDEVFPDHQWRGRPIELRHEPILLETGGGLKNVEDLLHGERIVIYNGDIITDLPLAPLLAEHERAGNEVTLAVRSQGGPLHITLDDASGRVVDIHGKAGSGRPGKYLFTGVYIVEPRFLTRLQPGVKESVVAAFLRMIAEGARLGGIVLDQGRWEDVGTLELFCAADERLSRP